jgi:NitT/TauT family transport system ATP-binding protein
VIFADRHHHREPALLLVQGLTKQFNGQRVVQGFDLELAANGFTVLIGPSGCGKSTFFDLLMGVVAADAGRIQWQGQTVPHLERVAAYMQQRDLLLPWLSLAGNARLPADIAGGVSGAERVKQLFERLGLAGFEAHLPAMVSGGMRQRCALARTLMFERDLVLLDEPLSALDAITRRQLQFLLRMLQDEFRRTILMVTHDIEEALLLADEVLVLSPMPMTVRERFILEMPKPRRVDDTRLTAIKAHVLDLLEASERP